MFADTQPAQLDGRGGPDPWGEFRVGHPQERRSLLRQLRDGSVSVQLAAANGAALTTTLWAFDDTGLVFTADPHLPQLSALQSADECTAVAYLESVKLQFEVAGLVVVRSGQAASLKCQPPRDIYRFQRRQSYRVRTDERLGPQARLRHPGWPDMQLALRVMDVSIGGCALWQPDDVPPLPVGATLAGVEVTLDPSTHFEAALTLHHVSTIGGGRGARVGCSWRLAPPAERSLQRWIDQAQKRRRLLTLG